MASSAWPKCAGLPRDIQTQQGHKEDLTVPCELALVHGCLFLDPCFCCWAPLSSLSGLACPDALSPASAVLRSFLCCYRAGFTATGQSVSQSVCRLSVSVPPLFVCVCVYVCTVIWGCAYIHRCTCMCMYLCVEVRG